MKSSLYARRCVPIISALILMCSLFCRTFADCVKGNCIPVNAWQIALFGTCNQLMDEETTCGPCLASGVCQISEEEQGIYCVAGGSESTGWIMVKTQECFFALCTGVCPNVPNNSYGQAVCHGVSAADPVEVLWYLCINEEE